MNISDKKIIFLTLAFVAGLATGKCAFGMNIWKAIADNNIEKVREFVSDEKFDVNQIDDYGNTVFYKACYKNNIDIVKLLLDVKDIDINKANKFGETPLYWAYRNSNLQIVKLLLDNGVKESINTVDENKTCTELYWACYNNNLEMVKFIASRKLSQSCDKDYFNKAYFCGETPLYQACYKNNIEIVELLLEYGANVDDRAIFGINNNQNKEDGKKILDLLNLTKQFDAAKDKKSFINNYEKYGFKCNVQEEVNNLQIPFSANGYFTLHRRLRNSKEEREKTLFGAQMSKEYNKYENTQFKFLI